MRAKKIDQLMTFVFFATFLIVSLLVIAFVSKVIIGGLMVMNPTLLKGVMNPLFNTIFLVLVALVVSTPIGILAGSYLAIYATKGRFVQFLRLSMETLSSLPSIVVGLFGYLIFLVVFGLEKSLIAGALSVSILTLPLITTTTEDALRSLPQGYLLGSLGMGSTKSQALFRVLLPACLPRISTGIILAAGRGFGEAAIFLFTAGSGTMLNWTRWSLTSPTSPISIFRPSETLATQIWNLQSNGQNPELAALSSAVLLILVLVFNVGANWLASHIKKKQTGEAS